MIPSARRARYSSGCAAIRRRVAVETEPPSEVSWSEPRALRRAREARASAPARPGPGGDAYRTPWRAPAGGTCSRRRTGRSAAWRRRSPAGARRSPDSACPALERGQAGCYDQAASRGPLPWVARLPGRAQSAPGAVLHDGRGSAGEPGCQRTCKRNAGERDGTRWDRTAPRRANVPAQSRYKGTERHRPARALRCS